MDLQSKTRSCGSMALVSFPKAQELSKLIDAKILGISTKEVNKKREKIRDNPNARPSQLTYSLNGKSKNFQANYNPISKPLTAEGEHWNGWKVGGIKPAWEPILWAIKPPEGSYCENVLKWGVGAVNVEECRIPTNWDNDPSKRGFGYGWMAGQKFKGATNFPSAGQFKATQGRFPANVILDEEAARMLDEQSGIRKSGFMPAGTPTKKSSNITYGKWNPGPIAHDTYGDSGGTSRFFYCAKASRREREAGLNELSNQPMPFNEIGFDETKRNRQPRENMAKNIHPTVKPIALFEWLIKLVTRQGQLILDPFLGSGTTMIAAHKAGRKCIGIEKEAEYIEIAKRRAAYWQAQPVQLGMEKEA